MQKQFGHVRRLRRVDKLEVVDIQHDLFSQQCIFVFVSVQKRRNGSTYIDFIGIGLNMDLFVVEFFMEKVQ